MVLGLVLSGAPADAIPLISEVFYDASGSDDGRGFVELWGLPGTSLEGMSLQGVNGSNGAVTPIIDLSGVIGAGGLFVVADRTSEGTTEVPGADLLANFDFQNGPDSVQLWFGELLLDAVGYGVFGVGEIFAGEGTPTLDPPAGSSIARLFANVDTDDNASDFGTLDPPTPGSAPLAPIPEPNTALLLAAGLVALGQQRRRASASEDSEPT